MGSLVPGWDNPKHEPDFREMSKPEQPEVPEWLQRVRSTDSDRDVKHAMDAAHKGLKPPSLTRTSLTSSSQGTSPNSHPLSGDGVRRSSLQLNRKSAHLSLEAQPEGIKVQDPEERINWWKRVESSYGNAKPDAEKPEHYKAGNYVPQYDVAKHHLNEAA